MNTKEKLINDIMEYGVPLDLAVDQKQLETRSISELQSILSDVWTKYRKAEEDKIQQGKDQAEAARINAELLKQQLRETHRPQFEAEQNKQLVLDRLTFAEAARELKFKICEANFNLIRQILGAGFSVQNIKDQSSHLGVGHELVPATAAELTQWENERIQARNNYLQTADPQTLRVEAKAEAVQNRQTAVLTAFEKELIAGLTRDAGLPLLPEYWNGGRLDKNFIKTADKELFRLLVRKFGSSRITARINDVTKIGNFSL